MAELPIDDLLPQLEQALQSSPRVILQAAPGAGKTTRVPLALRDSGWLQGRKIIMLEPRRLAARAAARFMSASLQERVGATVGYRVRLDTRVGEQTRVEVVTEGILTRMLQQDPALEDVGLLIFDEFHERNLQSDLALALGLNAQSLLREDLRILVMSATLEQAPLARLLGDCPVLSSAGRSFPVDIRYRPLREDYFRQRRAFCNATARFVTEVLDREDGSLLVFLPGVGEIRQVYSALREAGLPADVQLAPLYGQLDSAAQDEAIAAAPAERRKVVLATAVAETSLTIEGIRVVIDAGLMRRAAFDPNSGLDRLVTLPVSRAAAAQRAGRAGRLQAGVCFRLWSEHRHLLAHSSAEIVNADLAALALDLAQWGVRDSAELPWLDPPPAAHLAQARDLLVHLQALDTDLAITAHGRELAQLGVHPRLAQMMVQGRRLGCTRLGCELAALLSERDPLRAADSDMQSRVEWLRTPMDAADRAAGQHRRLRGLVAQWRQQLGAGPEAAGDDLPMCGVLLAFAYPDRIARRRAGQANRFLLASGRGARFRDAEPLAAQDYLVAAHLDGEQEALIFLAAAIRSDELLHYHQALTEQCSTVTWDADAGCVQARRQTRLGELVLDDRRIERPDPQAVAAEMLRGVRQQGLDCLPWTDAVRQLQARVKLLHELDPAGWPDFNDERLLADAESWLLPHLPGITRLGQLKRLDLADMLLGRLDWEQRRRLDELAPTHIRVPSGSRIALDYRHAPPVLAVRLQEMFGLEDTPRIAAGRVTLLLHLLSPARRPVQVTRDLGGFWRGSYHAVKKDMRGRYPKHHWPDDPAGAQPTARAKPRR